MSAKAGKLLIGLNVSHSNVWKGKSTKACFRPLLHQDCWGFKRKSTGRYVEFSFREWQGVGKRYGVAKGASFHSLSSFFCEFRPSGKGRQDLSVRKQPSDRS